MYGKLFASLYQGTLRGKSDAILVFTNMIAFADAEGFVDKHPSAIADETGLSIERVRDAIDVLMAPDLESRSPEMDGKRLVFIDDHRNWGWRIVNHAKYRAIRTEEDRREQNRLAQERYRAKRKNQSAGVSNSKQPSAGVSDDQQGKPKQKQKQQEEVEEENSLSLIFQDSEEFQNLWEKRKVKFQQTQGTQLPETQAVVELMELSRRGLNDAIKDLQMTLLKGYGRTICQHDKFNDSSQSQKQSSRRKIAHFD